MGKLGNFDGELGLTLGKLVWKLGNFGELDGEIGKFGNFDGKVGVTLGK